MRDGAGMAVPVKPIRIQRKRTKGWKMPKNTIYVGRPGKWGNPISVADYSNPCSLSKEILQSYARDDFMAMLLTGELDYGVTEIRKELRGKNLACWCRLDEPCHADILLELANK